MLLHDKAAVIYGGGGAIGGAIARVFAREGAHVFLAGRTRPSLGVVARTGGLDIAVNAMVAAFVASDRAGAMTGAIVNLTCGSLVD